MEAVPAPCSMRTKVSPDAAEVGLPERPDAAMPAIRSRRNDEQRVARTQILLHHSAPESR